MRGTTGGTWISSFDVGLAAACGAWSQAWQVVVDLLGHSLSKRWGCRFGSSGCRLIVRTLDYNMASPSASGYAIGRILRPSAIPAEHARGHNRSLVLQTLYRSGSISRADLARATGLTRVTISDLVSDLIGDDLIVELGQREDARPGKPATLLDINRTGSRSSASTSATSAFRGGVLDLDGGILEHREVALENATGQAVIDK